MAKVKTDPEKAQQQLARKAAAQDRRERQEREIRARRTEQLRTAESELGRLEEAVSVARERKSRHEALSDHLVGFYDEVDKLTKGRSLLEATSLIVDQMNDIIRDAKSIIDDDPYLERIKEFVPAGNNPVYPDVLMVARAVQQSIGRAEKSLTDRERRVTKMRRDARTIVAALKAFAAHGKHPSKEEVEDLLNAKPPDDWFFQGNDENFYFDFERLDGDGVERVISPAD